MGFQAANLFLVDPARAVVRAHRSVGDEPTAALEAIEFRLDSVDSLTGAVARPACRSSSMTSRPPTSPCICRRSRALNVRSLVAVPLRVSTRVFGVLGVVASVPNRFADADVDLLAAVASNVALAVDRAENFQTIEDLSRGLEDKVRVRTEQLRAAGRRLASAYRVLQSTQMHSSSAREDGLGRSAVAGVAPS